jgi:DNA transformation protein
MKGDTFKDFVLDQLHTLNNVTIRSMFGGKGLYQDGIFFGIIFKGRLYFKTDADSETEYKNRGMKPFQPSAKQTLKTYYEVPADILEDDDLLTQWARWAINAQDKNPLILSGFTAFLRLARGVPFLRGRFL